MSNSNVELSLPVAGHRCRHSGCQRRTTRSRSLSPTCSCGRCGTLCCLLTINSARTATASSSPSSQVNRYRELNQELEEQREALLDYRASDPSRSLRYHAQDRGRPTASGTDSRRTRSPRRSLRSSKVPNNIMKLHKRHDNMSLVTRSSGSPGSVSEHSISLPTSLHQWVQSSSYQQDGPPTSREVTRRTVFQKDLTPSHSTSLSQRSDSAWGGRAQSTSLLNSPRGKVLEAQNDPVEFNINNVEGPRKEPAWEVKAEINEPNSGPSGIYYQLIFSEDC